VKCVEFFGGCWLIGVDESGDVYPGCFGVEAWQAR